MALYRMVASGTTPGESFSFTLHAEGSLSTADAATAFGDALTAAWAGDKELALQQLDAGLRAPVASVALSYGGLKLLPFWDPLRGDPRFEKIVESLAPKESAATAK